MPRLNKTSFAYLKPIYINETARSYICFSKRKDTGFACIPMSFGVSALII